MTGVIDFVIGTWSGNAQCRAQQNGVTVYSDSTDSYSGTNMHAKERRGVNVTSHRISTVLKVID